MELSLGLTPVPADRRPLPMSAADAINHEFRNPLATLLGHLEMVSEHADLPPELRASLAAMDRAGQRLTELLRERSAELPPDVASSLDAMQRAGDRLSDLVTAYADIAEITELSYFPH